MQLKLASLSALITLAAATGIGDLPITLPTNLPGIPTTTISLPPLPTLPGLPELPASQCNTGPVQCCNTVQSSDSEPIAALLGLLGVVLQDLNVQVGVTCTPITVIGAGGNSCSATPVCCSNNDFNGLIALGCVPVNLNL
ncbi:hypothetical protein VNI00_015049 [Paramarasmius palmivorus]|uniref:Hydrophobin n=1 Tax=Paramarasmius palmivorus TaxID=297713 RepID=A0AAW0BNW0_9AGAR